MNNSSNNNNNDREYGRILEFKMRILQNKTINRTNFIYLDIWLQLPPSLIIKSQFSMAFVNLITTKKGLIMRGKKRIWETNTVLGLI